MSENNRSSSDIAGPAILKLLGLPPETEKLTLTLAGGADIKVECMAFIRDDGTAEKLHKILAEYGVTQTVIETVEV